MITNLQPDFRVNRLDDEKKLLGAVLCVAEAHAAGKREQPSATAKRRGSSELTMLY